VREKSTRGAQDASVKAALALTERTLKFHIRLSAAAFPSSSSAAASAEPDSLSVLQWAQLVQLYNTDTMESEIDLQGYDCCQVSYFKAGSDNFLSSIDGKI